MSWLIPSMVISSSAISDLLLNFSCQHWTQSKVFTNVLVVSHGHPGARRGQTACAV